MLRDKHEVVPGPMTVLRTFAACLHGAVLSLESGDRWFCPVTSGVGMCKAVLVRKDSETSQWSTS